MLKILILSHFIWAQEPLLQGVWRQDCLHQALRTEHFKNAVATLTESYYGNKACTQPVLDFESHGDFAAKDGKIDFAFQQISITIHDLGYLNDYNDRQVCGVSTWHLGKPENVTGKFCEIFGPGFGIQVPPADQKRFGIYKIEGDRLYFGQMSAEQDSSTPDKRPTEFDGRFYRRSSKP